MTKEVLARFFSESISHLNLEQATAASTFASFSGLACPEGSGSLPIQSPSPLSPDCTSVKRNNVEIQP